MLPVACTPRSGSFFKLGRTKVICSASDSSGNMRQAGFIVTVKRSVKRSGSDEEGLDVPDEGLLRNSCLASAADREP